MRHLGAAAGAAGCAAVVGGDGFSMALRQGQQSAALLALFSDSWGGFSVATDHNQADFSFLLPTDLPSSKSVLCQLTDGQEGRLKPTVGG